MEQPPVKTNQSFSNDLSVTMEPSSPQINTVSEKVLMPMYLHEQITNMAQLKGFGETTSLKSNNIYLEGKILCKKEGDEWTCKGTGEIHLIDRDGYKTIIHGSWDTVAGTIAVQTMSCGDIQYGNGILTMRLLPGDESLDFKVKAKLNEAGEIVGKRNGHDIRFSLNIWLCCQLEFTHECYVEGVCVRIQVPRPGYSRNKGGRIFRGWPIGGYQFQGSILIKGQCYLLELSSDWVAAFCGAKGHCYVKEDGLENFWCVLEDASQEIRKLDDKRSDWHDWWRTLEYYEYSKLEPPYKLADPMSVGIQLLPIAITSTASMAKIVKLPTTTTTTIAVAWSADDEAIAEKILKFQQSITKAPSRDGLRKFLRSIKCVVDPDAHAPIIRMRYQEYCTFFLSNGKQGSRPLNRVDK